VTDHQRRAGTRWPSGTTSSAPKPARVVVVVLLVLGYVAAFGTIADIRLHQAAEEQRSVNLHGYRGPLARQRKVEQVRILVLGGHWAFGTGLVQAETPPAYLDRNLHQRWRPENIGLSVTVVNLAGPGDGPASYVTTLDDYRSLDGDIICLLDDPIREEGAAAPWRHQSALFRQTGYFPLLPRAFAAEPASQTQLFETRRRDSAAAPDCATALKRYCDGLTAAIDYGLATRKRVLVVRPPAGTADERAREETARQLLQSRFGTNAAVRVVDLSREETLVGAAASGRGLTAGEADRLADLITSPMLDLMRQ
jgi:hypothetical protein